MSWVIGSKRKEKRIESGDSFIIVQALTQGDKDDRQDLLMTMKVQNAKAKDLKDENSSEARLLLGTMRHFERCRSIKSWNLKDEQGKDVPLTPENIKKLPPEAVREVDKAIEELNPELDDEKKSE